jgi:hypothetical protein
MQAAAALPTNGDAAGGAASRHQREGLQHDEIVEPRRNPRPPQPPIPSQRRSPGAVAAISQVSYNVVVQSTANHVVDLSWYRSTSSNSRRLQRLSQCRRSDMPDCLLRRSAIPRTPIAPLTAMRLQRSMETAVKAASQAQSKRLFLRFTRALC